MDYVEIFLLFFESYLLNRKRITKIVDSSNNIFYSDTIISTRGVAQGSNLGPLLFNIYINEIHKVVENCYILLYTDDIVIIKSSRDIHELKNHIETDLNNLNTYINILDQTINSTKTKAMLFTRRKNFNIDIILNNQPIEFVKEFKYLGLIIDKKLTFQPHINSIVKKVNQANGKIYFLSSFLPIYALKKIFFSIIYCHLNLHILVWGGACFSHINPLTVAVNKAIRNIYKTNDNTITKYKKLGILTVSQIYDLRLAEFLFTFFSLNERQLNFDILTEISADHTYNTRNRDRLRPPPIQTEVNRRFFINNAVHYWPTVPDEIKNSGSLPTFRKKMKDMFFKEV